MAITANKISTTEKPEDLFEDLVIQSKTNRVNARSSNTMFKETNIKKVGYNIFVNRLASLLIKKKPLIDITTKCSKMALKNSFL